MFRNATIDYRRQQWIVLPQQWKTLLLLLLLARAVNLTCRWNIVTQITITNHPTKGIVCVSVKAFEIKVTSFQIYVVRGFIYRCYKSFTTNSSHLGLKSLVIFTKRFNAFNCFTLLWMFVYEWGFIRIVHCKTLRFS